MRRRATAHRAAEHDQTQFPLSNSRSRFCAGPCGTTGSNPSDGVGDVRGLFDMADQGVGSPESRVEGLRPTVTDLGSSSEATSDEEEEVAEGSTNDDSDEDSDSDTDDGSGASSQASLERNGPPGTDPNLIGDGCGGGALVPAAGGGFPQQQATNVATYGNISVKDSSGIHFGNKTVYNGPVIIEQHVYGSKVVKQFDDSLQLNFGSPLAITDGSETGVLRKTGLELGSFRIGPTSSTVSKGGSGFLWRHLLGRGRGSSTWVAWVALCVGCMAILAVILTVTFLTGATKRAPVATRDIGDIESEEISNGYKTPPKHQNRTILSRRRLVVVPRREWVAQPPASTTLIKHPVEYVVISQTATDSCTTQAECTLIVRYIQVFHVESKKWMDIGYNFLVAGDGQAYEGRGWDVVGAHTTAGFNGISMGIAFVGIFDTALPPPIQIRACKLLIEEGVKLGKISPNYKLIGDRQVSSSRNPGEKLFEELKTWEHWTAVV
ncbi:peptidoglycan-recognition protein LC-like [Hetaerina americana]|uniref:peptidoglycan-recognition protein LC-like n=1 Tax=Hetaerina americana TaxID=62018 RepID=UPI003A7F1593